MAGRVSIQAPIRQPTITVAAADSSARAKRAADVVCGGTDDQVGIQKAIAKLASHPGILSFAPGEFRLSAPIECTAAAVRGIDGNNARIVVSTDIDAIRFTGNASGSASPLTPSTASIAVPEMNPFIRNLRVQGDQTSPMVGVGIRVEKSFGLIISQCQFMRLNTGIDVVGNNRNQIIANNHIWHCTETGLRIRNGDHHQFIVTGNHISYCRRGVHVTGMNSLDNLIFTSNDVESRTTTEQTPLHLMHFQNNRMQDIRIMGNTLEDHANCTSQLIRIERGSQANDTPRNVQIVGNTLNDALTGAVYCDGGRNIAVKSNVSHAVRGPLLNMDLSVDTVSVDVTDNQFYGFNAIPDRILRVSGASTHSIVDVDVSGNSMYHTRGWILHMENLVAVTGLAVRNNFLNRGGTTPGPTSGLTMETGIASLGGVHISGNIWRGNGDSNRPLRITAGSYPGPIFITDNIFDDWVLSSTIPTQSIVRNTTDFVTENNGTAVVASGSTSIVVTHGLNRTPALKDISVTPTNSLGNATKFWISTPTATQFTINVDADPGATTATFAWSAEIKP